MVSTRGLSVDPQKSHVVTEWQVPKDKQELRSFLGLCSYYRRFVYGFTNIAKPLTKLSEEGGDFGWNSDCQEAFEQLKSSLVSTAILGYPSAERQFILEQLEQFYPNHTMDRKE